MRAETGTGSRVTFRVIEIIGHGREAEAVQAPSCPWSRIGNPTSWYCCSGLVVGTSIRVGWYIRSRKSSCWAWRQGAGGEGRPALVVAMVASVTQV